MVDFHTHILPGIDDGSRDLKTTEGLLLQEWEQGVQHVVLTPHFYADQMSFDSFLENRQSAYEKTRALIDSHESAARFPKLSLAAEVFYFTGISRAERISELCIEGTNILMLEMPFDQWTQAIVDEVSDLIRKRGLRVVLVHIERFYPLQKDKTYLHRILDLPLMLQINAGSFTRFGEGRLLKKILATEKKVILGSDTHSLHRRPVTISQGLTTIEKKAGKEALSRIIAAGDELGRELLTR